MVLARRTFAFSLLVAALLSACGSAASTPADPNSVVTSIAGSLVAMHFQAQTSAAPALPTFGPVSPTASTFSPPTSSVPTATRTFTFPTLGTLAPTFTPVITGTVYTPTLDPNSLASGCNNLAFITDITIPPGTYLKPGEEFGKTWKVSNTGTCNWLYHYALVPLSPGAFGGQTTLINKLVVPGHWADVSVAMQAPDSTGTYSAYWRMADADGNLFGATLAATFKVTTEPTDMPEPPTETETSTPTP